MTEQTDFAGGIAVITGAGAGIGAALAREAARLGMTVVVADLSAERADAVAAEIEASGGRAEAAVVDVSDAAAMDALASGVRARHGAVRLLINNAGIELFGFSWELSAEQWRRLTEVNVLGVVNGVRAFTPGMIEAVGAGSGRAAIANLSSVGAFMAGPMNGPYIMSKHAVLALTDCLMLEMELLGLPIDVSVIIPSHVRTRIFNDAEVNAGGAADWADAYRRRLAQNAQGSIDADEAARTVFEQLLARDYWVSTQPDDTAAYARRRGELYQTLARPRMEPAILGRLVELKPEASS